MLPFPSDNSVRKFTCFVCGRQYEDFAEFTTHIKEKHEEGRDYIICPLKRCQAPVRDIKMHFKAKHVDEKIPAGIQYKATIWRDFNQKTGKIKVRKPGFREGTFVSSKNGGKELKYRSGYECQVYECLELINDVIAYDAEPFYVDYIFEGTPHKYYPDLSVYFADGRVEIWEIKPQNQTSLDKNKAKWAACQLFCEARGWKFEVITEQGISKIKKLSKG
jgi:hypothetical protein